jgi:hypothetical protein
MPAPDPPTVLLSTDEAAARLGLTPAGVRSRIRRGSLRAEHGRSGQLLVEVPVHGGATAALPEHAGRPRPAAPAARSGSPPTPRIVPLAAVVIGGIVVAYLSNRFRKR